MYCKNCGNKLRTNSVFCSKCGKKVEKIEQDNKEIIEASFEEKGESIHVEEHKESVNDSVKTKMMYCRHCGKEIDIESRVCPKCGYNLKSSSTVDPFTNFIICAISFLLPIVGFILWLVMRSENNSKAKNALIASCVGILTGFFFLFLVFVFVVVLLITV